MGVSGIVPGTRLHSSRMHTAHVLTVSPSMLCAEGGVPGPGGKQGVYLVLGGVYLVCGGGVPGPGGCTWSGGVPGPVGCIWSEGVYLVRGGVPGQELPPVDRITDACKNITLPQLRCGR